MRPVLALLAFLTVVFSAAAGEKIPFDFVDGYILVKARIHAHPVTLVLDSGASASILGIDAARRLHLPLGSPVPIDGVDARATAFSLAPASATASGVPLGDFTLAADLHNAAQLCSRPIDGLIGADFFKGRITQIDYARHTIRLLAIAPSDGQSLPLRAQNGVYCLPVSVNGSHPRWTRLDTGCNDALHWVVPRSEEIPTSRGVSIGFITNTADESLVTIRLGRLTLPEVETVLHATPIFPGESGLLGSEILSQYRVTIDAPHSRILLAPAPR